MKEKFVVGMNIFSKGKAIENRLVFKEPLNGEIEEGNHTSWLFISKFPSNN